MKHTIVDQNEDLSIAVYRKYRYHHHRTGMSIAVLPVLSVGCKIDIQAVNVPETLSKKAHHPFKDHNNLCEIRQELVGLRMEDLPCWQVTYEEEDHLHYTCVTGTVEPNENPVDTMFRELREETGLVLGLDSATWTCAGPMFQTKGTNLQVLLYILRVFDATLMDLIPDNNDFEKNSKCVWLTRKELNTEPQLDLLSRCLSSMLLFSSLYL